MEYVVVWKRNILHKDHYRIGSKFEKFKVGESFCNLLDYT